MAVTETRSCTKGSVFLINYSLTIVCSHSNSQFSPKMIFSFSFSFLTSFSKMFVLFWLREMKTATFADGKGTEIIIYSYYDFLHKFHYTYFVYFPEDCTEFDDNFFSGGFWRFDGWIIKSKSKAARDKSEESGKWNGLFFCVLCVRKNFHREPFLGAVS